MRLVLNGEEVQRLRLSRPESQESLAARAGISAYWLMHLERGKRRVHPGTASKLAAALNVSVTDLTEVA